MIKRILILVVLAIVAFVPKPIRRAELRVGSKKFTESVILGEAVRMLLANAGRDVAHLQELGGTQILFQSLVSGEIDAYPEYTGTLLREVFSKDQLQTTEDLTAALDKLQLKMTAPLGFNNTYALGMNKDRAQELGIRKISDLARHPNIRLGFGNEFTQRDDGWPGLSKSYGLQGLQANGLDHDIAYKQLSLDQIDVTDVYATDARIRELDLLVLEDDRNFFPRYDAVILYRNSIPQKAALALSRLAGEIDESQMQALNSEVVLQQQPATQVAADFLKEEFEVTASVHVKTRFERILQRTLEHLDLVRRSLLPAILFGIPMGILATKNKWLGHLFLGGSSIVQTIPSLALLVILMPLASMIGLSSVGAGSGTAIMALFLYSLLPIVRNTYTGLTSIPVEIHESAAVLNLNAWYQLFEIDLPLASRAILSGIKTSAVINVGFATLGALVGAGGYGQPILAGIRLADTGLILEGALPAAALALIVQWTFDLTEQRIVSPGLR